MSTTYRLDFTLWTLTQTLLPIRWKHIRLLCMGGNEAAMNVSWRSCYCNLRMYITWSSLSGRAGPGPSKSRTKLVQSIHLS
jgi:hypothetical protein